MPSRCRIVVGIAENVNRVQILRLHDDLLLGMTREDFSNGREPASLGRDVRLTTVDRDRRRLPVLADDAIEVGDGDCGQFSFAQFGYDC